MLHLYQKNETLAFIEWGNIVELIMELTQEQQADINQRVEDFKKDYQALVDKYQVDFVNYPQYVQITHGVFATVSNLQIVDKKYIPVPSPLDKESIIKEK